MSDEGVCRTAPATPGLLKTASDGAHTHRTTDGYGDSMTESAQWGRFSENCKMRQKYFCWVT